MSKCEFVDELKKLKESSKEAIEGIEDFSPFKEYMHVQREPEIVLIDFITNNALTIKKHLIMVCGSVGDGKSHVISQVKHKYPELIKEYNIHNDATESNRPSKSYKEILDEKLEPFSDDEIDVMGNQKLILAINLGTLSNFIEDPIYNEKYSQLKRYINDNKIIENTLAPPKSNLFFDYVNFSDYELFELSREGPQSQFMEEILNKVFSKDLNNPFHIKYQNCCVENCTYNLVCPIKMNYEFMKVIDIRKRIAAMVIEIIVKYKVIISTRSLLNFFYDILVPVEFESLNDRNSLAELNEIYENESELFKFLMPNLLYEHQEKSVFFKALSNIDPINQRYETIDQFSISLVTTDEKQKLIEERFNNQSGFSVIESVINEKLPKLSKQNSFDDLLKLLIRFSRFSIEFCKEPSEVLYSEYMIDLYYSNSNNNGKLKRLYQKTTSTIYLWNGKSEEGWINLNDSFMQDKFLISQELKIEPYIDDSKPLLTEPVIKQFMNEIELNYRKMGCGQIIKFILDYSLYELLDKVNNGYRLNKKDNDDFIGFIESLIQIINLGCKKKSIKITYKANQSDGKFILKEDIFGGYTFERI